MDVNDEKKIAIISNKWMTMRILQKAEKNDINGAPQLARARVGTLYQRKRNFLQPEAPLASLNASEKNSAGILTPDIC